MKSLLTPAIWIVAIAVLLHTGLVTPNLALINFALGAALIAGLLIAWRFHSSRIFFALLVMFLCERALSYFSSVNTASGAPGKTALAAIGILLPLDFVLLSLTREKGFTVSAIGPPALLLFFESVVVAILCRPGPLATVGHRALHHPVIPQPLPFATVTAFSIAAILLLLRFLLYRKPAESGLLWALVASFLSLRFGGAGLIPDAYFAAAAAILAVSLIETSYLLAYHDELTSLPSRRAFHDALLGLQAPYSIAMVDIDHFKRCNDTYGHDTGDQVLRLVASRLARVGGGGHAYRYGGEEFAIVFPGKTTPEVMDHLEQLRAAIESSSFRLRAKDRRQEARGPDRRNVAVRGKGALRALPSETVPTELSVTASIGVASASQENLSAEEVIKSADRGLYRAKAAGRNRIETAAAPRRRTRRKAADIA